MQANLKLASDVVKGSNRAFVLKVIGRIQWTVVTTGADLTRILSRICNTKVTRRAIFTKSLISQIL